MMKKLILFFLIGALIGTVSAADSLTVKEIKRLALNTTQTNQWSRGTGRYYGPVITDGGLPLSQNNGWGSIDLQPDTFPEVAGAFAGTPNTNSAGGIACHIGGGFGNLIYQNQEGYDSQGFKCIGSSIGGGAFNTIINADTCGIGIGDHNYIGPSPGSPQNYVDDSFIPFGISCAIFDAIDAGAMGWACTNSAGGGSWCVGWHSWLDGGGTLAWGEYVWIRGTTSHGVAAIGKNILLTNAMGSFAYGQGININGATNAGAVGINITNNSANGDWSFGIATNAITVKSNGQLRVNGPLFVSSGTSTNRSRFTMDAANPFPTVDTPYTNRSQQATVRFTVGCYTITGTGDTAYAYLLVDQDADGTYEENDNFVGWADQATTLSATFQISADLQPNARFMLALTNSGFGGVDISSSRISYK